jgi:hypothetical protein
MLFVAASRALPREQPLFVRLFDLLENRVGLIANSPQGGY